MAWRRVWIFKRELKTRTTYSLRWYDDRNRMLTEAIGSDKRLAMDARRRRELELNSGKFMDVTPIRLSEFVAEHLRLAERRLAPGTLRAYRDTFRFFQEHSGDLVVSVISIKTVEEYLTVTTGMRRGEVCALEWSDLDLEAGWLATTLGYYTHVGAASIKVAQALLPYDSIVSKSYHGQFSGPGGGFAVVVKQAASA